MKQRTCPLFPPHAYRFKGGGGAPAGPLPAPPAPAASQSDLAVTQAKQEAKQAAARKQGINYTIMGQAGAGNNPADLRQPQKNVVLGGG